MHVFSQRLEELDHILCHVTEIKSGILCLVLASLQTGDHQKCIKNLNQIIGILNHGFKRAAIFLAGALAPQSLFCAITQACKRRFEIMRNIV